MKTKKDMKVDLKKFCQFPFPDDQEWKQIAEESLKGKSFETLMTSTYEGIDLKPLYVKKDVEGLSHIDDLPGEGSFVRGIRNLYDQERAWEVSQEITDRSPKSFNEAILHDIERGQSMINLVVDEATKRGLDSDIADEEVIGQNGVPISSLSDIEDALSNLNLTQNRLFIQTGISTLPIYASLIAYMKKNNRNIQDLQGYIGLDPIGTIASCGQIQVGIKRLYHVMSELVKWSNQNTSSVRTIYVQGEVYHNAGSSATEELAFVLATGVEYISEMLERGLEIDEVAKQIYFSFAVGSNVFMEIAKLRAARLLWSKIIKSFGGNEESQKIYIHVRTSSWTKTIYDPYVNMLRTTTEAFAGAVGGANSMHVSPFDEAIRPSDSFSRRIARNTQIILQEESYLNQIVDPAGGSWYVEALTDAVAEKAWQLFQEVEKNDGMYQALSSGFVQQQIFKTADKKRTNIELRKDRIVGTNMYSNLEEKPLHVREAVEEFKALRKAALTSIKATNRANAARALEEVRNALLHNEPLLPSCIEAALQGATIGEIMNVLAENCKGTQVEKLNRHRGAEGFEQLRKAADKFKQQTGEYPKIFFINVGSIPKHKARSDFSTGFFAAGGFEAVKNNGYSTTEEAVEAAISSQLDLIMICGTDEQYTEFVPTISKQLKENNENIYLMVAGKPSKELEQKYIEAGVDEFIHIGSNCYQTLARLQERKGVN